MERTAVGGLAQTMSGGEYDDPIEMRRQYIRWLSRQPPDVIEQHMGRMPLATDAEMENADYVRSEIGLRRQPPRQGGRLHEAMMLEEARPRFREPNALLDLAPMPAYPQQVRR